MDDKPGGGADERADQPPPDPEAGLPVTVVAAAETGAGAQAEAEAEAEAEIVDLPWDDDLPVALGEETDDEAARAGGETAEGATDPAGATGVDGLPDGDADPDEPEEHEWVTARRNALPRRVESWRTRSASGAIATAIAMGLQQVFEPERRRPAAVAEAPSDPYDDDDPITVDYVPDDAEATRVHVKPWLLQKGDPT